MIMRMITATTRAMVITVTVITTITIMITGIITTIMARPTVTLRHAIEAENVRHWPGHHG